MFPNEIAYPNGTKIKIDMERLLLSVKNATTAAAVSSKLAGTNFALDTPPQPNAVINNTSRRYWLKKQSGDYHDDDVFTLRTRFGSDYEWVGPVYTFSDPSGPMKVCPVPDTIIVRLTSSAYASEPQVSNELYTKYKMKKSDALSKYSGERTNHYTLEDPATFDAYKARKTLHSEVSTFEHFRFSHMPEVVPTAMMPNDEANLTDRQWNVERIGVGGTGVTAWDLMSGDEQAAIGILDTGCDISHVDLAFEHPGRALDTMTPPGSPVPGPNTNAAHGTAVAGVAAARLNNQRGVAGVAGHSRIVPLRFTNWTDDEFIRALHFADEIGVRVINMSGRCCTPDTADIDMALQALAERILLCAASGNADAATIDYPARNPNVMACGASNQADGRKVSAGAGDWGSNHGPELSVVAPGVDIPTTDITGALGYNPTDFMPDLTVTPVPEGFSGTSAATAHVSGLASSILGVCPDLSPAEVRHIIERTADKVGTVPYDDDPNHPNGTWNPQMGYGRINAMRALVAAGMLNPRTGWFRELAIDGNVYIFDHEDIGENEEGTFLFSKSGIPPRYPLGPFQTHATVPPWIEKHFGEIRTEVRLVLDWKPDSSIDVTYNIRFYEGTSEDTTDLEGERSGVVNVPADGSGTISERIDTGELLDETHVKVHLSLENRKQF